MDLIIRDCKIVNKCKKKKKGMTESTSLEEQGQERKWYKMTKICAENAEIEHFTEARRKLQQKDQRTKF